MRPCNCTGKFGQPRLSQQICDLTVTQLTPHSAPKRGINLWAVFFPSFTPVRNLTVTGMSPKAWFMPTRLLPSFEGASSTKHMRNHSPQKKGGETKNSRALPLPLLNTKSMGQPQLTSTKSIPPFPISLAITSAAEASTLGLLPANWTPNIFSDGWRRRRDHSSLEPERRDCVTATKRCNSTFRRLTREKMIYSLHKWCPHRGQYITFERAFEIMRTFSLGFGCKNSPGFLLSSAGPDL